ncbi:MAG: DEAD/DEAH box helicase, partial [Pseudomonadota bacterium]|nr:DEAD/DEAH box helicase [Pseudomonadota bacterium]
RGAAGSGANAVRQGLADGSISVVIGTQAIASDKVRFARLGLVVIDEEQRFGDADKRKLAALKSGLGTVHSLVMTATPLPRTLQAAMVGLRDISIIATAPVRRQPTRTFVLPWDEAIVREALGREHGRGGQSFVVAPRIEDLGLVESQIRAWLPGLSLAVAHGKLKPERLEALVASFADGETDILLATNIIEAGLDIPRANTILITGPHRFGLAQLHQMRGRVGRGTRRGLAYVMTAPGTRLAGPTERRLRTLETMEGLGAGVTIAAADMDARGAGDLFGDAQAGHVHAIGTELYQHILAEELARIEGKPAAPPRPALHLGIEGRIPDDYVAETNLRLELYRRLARLATLEDTEDFAVELVDRFGVCPAPVACLLDEARLRCWCLAHRVVAVDSGPKATSVTMLDETAAGLLAALMPEATVKGDRILLQIEGRTPVERLRAMLHVITPPEVREAD